MLLGEHAVLHGHPCLTAAIEKRVRLSVVPQSDGLVTITSQLGSYVSDRQNLVEHPSFRFVIEALRQHPRSFPGGLEAIIQADMPPTIGFGTSAAVTVAMTAACRAAVAGSWSQAELLADARRVIQGVQGRGSGADAAASVYGGIIHYSLQHETMDVVSNQTRPLTALYCGYKTPTAEVIRRVEQAWLGKDAARDRIYERMTMAVEQCREAILADDDALVGKILSNGHTLMKKLGVGTAELDECADILKKDPGITGAKISGSGMGDCVVGWGRAEREQDRYESFALTTAKEGIRLE